MVKSPKTKLEYDLLSLKFLGAKLFKGPPLEIRKESFNKSFKSSLRNYLASNCLLGILTVIFFLFSFRSLSL